MSSKSTNTLILTAFNIIFLFVVAFTLCYGATEDNLQSDKIVNYAPRIEGSNGDWKYAKNEESKTQGENIEYQFVLKDAVVTVHGYKWIESLQAQTAKLDLNEIKTIAGVIYPKDGFKLISFECSFKPKTFGDVKFKNIRINLYSNEIKYNLVCWYITIGSPSAPTKMAMNAISKGACKILKPVVVFVVPNSASENNISVGTNPDEARPIVNLRNLKEEKI